MVKIAYHKIISNNSKKSCVKFIKPVILITSLMAFLYLVITTVNSNTLIAKKLSDSGTVDNVHNSNLNILDDAVRNYELHKNSDKFVNGVIKDLELVPPNLYAEDAGGGELCEKNKSIYRNIITATPGDRLIDFIWEYISLWSLSKELTKVNQIPNMYLTDKTINGLSTLFDAECLKFPAMSTVPRKCVNFQLVKVLRTTDILNLNDYTEEVPFILEKKSKRVFEILASDLRPLRQELHTQLDLSELIEKFRQNITNSMSTKKPKEDSYKHVCSYIENQQHNYLPFLKSSIEFHNREGTSNIFIFMVPSNEHQFYSEFFETSKHEAIKVFSHNEQESFNVGLLIQCDRTIVLNDMTLAAALLNAGIATVPKDDPLFKIFKTRNFNWYGLSNGDDDSQ